MTWSHLDIDKTHLASACIGFFTFWFALTSVFFKETLVLGETPISAIYGLIIGPHSLNWVDPSQWGNFLYNTLEISRLLLCVELVAIGMELPAKYIYTNIKSIFYLLSFAMIVGWLLFAAFVYLLIPNYSFAWGLLISACVTATDPVLAQAIIGKCKYSVENVPSHIKKLLTAESGCNDGLAVPFVYLALNIITHSGNSSEIAKDFIVITILYECIFGCIFGVIVGYSASWLIRLSRKFHLIDLESNIFFPITISLFIAGISPILGIDDLLASFCAGNAYVWDDWLDRSDEEITFIDTLDIFLNISYFVYFGTIIPWDRFNASELGLDIWRLFILGIVFLTLRRFPAVLLQYKFNPDIRSLKEALFVSHFGPIGVSGLFASILAISELESFSLDIHHGPIIGDVAEDVQFSRLINTIYPIVTFLIVVSIVVHGCSTAIIVFFKYLKTKMFDNKLNIHKGDNTTNVIKH